MKKIKIDLADLFIKALEKKLIEDEKITLFNELKKRIDIKIKNTQV